MIRLDPRAARVATLCSRRGWCLDVRRGIIVGVTCADCVREARHVTVDA
jgi:hypothetical protein